MTVDALAPEPRALEILDQVKAIFASKGFDGASMQDLARAAGMSAGNFYRYFPSKDAIIEAIIERELAEVRGEFAQVIESPAPLDSFRGLVRRRIETIGDCDGLIWCEIEASAARRPEAAALLGRMEAEIIRGLVAVFARIADLSEAQAARRFSAHARLIVMLVQGVSMHRAVYHDAPLRTGNPHDAPGQAGDPHDAPARTGDPEFGALVVRAIEHTLCEVSSAADPTRRALSDAK